MTLPSAWKWDARWTDTERLSKEGFDWLFEVYKELHRPPNFTVANLPTSGILTGQLAYATNGRKVGEGVGAGTGTLVYRDASAWRRVGDDTTVAA